MRITLDTTILVRAHQNADGLARALLLELLSEQHTLVLSAPILDEVERVLNYPRLVKTAKLEPGQIAEYLEFLSVGSLMVDISEELVVPISDPKDVPVIQTAVTGKADILCTLDTHFYAPPVLEFCETHGIRVLKDLELVRLIRGPQE